MGCPTCRPSDTELLAADREYNISLNVLKAKHYITQPGNEDKDEDDQAIQQK